MTPLVPARSRTTLTVIGLLTLTAALGALLSACGSTSSGATNASSGAPNAAPDAHEVTVTISAARGCTANTLSAPAGPLTFTIINRDATAVSELELQSGERIVGEKENLPPGFSGAFSVNVDAGTYTLYCPGAKTENTSFTVTGTSARSGETAVDTLLSRGTAQYASYVTEQIGYLVTTSKALASALQGTDLAAAQAAYMKARPYYEKIEPVAESFTVGTDNLDNDIDARAHDVPLSQWEGFHRIEQGLFATKSLAGLSAYGTGLVANVTKLQTLTTGLSYQPFELANGAQELLDEVASSKITGEEERYSHIDLLDFEANDEGAEQAFAALQPALTQIDASLATQVASSFVALDALVDTYRTGTNPSGFVLYTTLTNTDKQRLAAAVKSVQQPLSQVASKVVNA